MLHVYNYYGLIQESDIRRGLVCYFSHSLSGTAMCVRFKFKNSHLKEIISQFPAQICFISLQTCLQPVWSFESTNAIYCVCAFLVTFENYFCRRNMYFLVTIPQDKVYYIVLYRVWRTGISAKHDITHHRISSTVQLELHLMPQRLKRIFLKRILIFSARLNKYFHLIYLY